MPGSGGQVEKQGWVPAGKKRVTVTQRKQCWPCVSLRQIIKVDTVYSQKIIPHGRRQGWPAKEGSDRGVERDHGNCTGSPLLQPGWNWLMIKDSSDGWVSVCMLGLRSLLFQMAEVCGQIFLLHLPDP